ncbi:tetratricopeptide repeat protein [Chondromyces apiculatus]|uniref:Uncharacterized protein n=1 Tax=Chondromyces apiculatus DSM 436 TaxID=1192034 RepID=A0A017T4H9_9BACT|nr:tetratricopeptide repeat protein [Chondromyces apiculatus]EYF03476.1 Hypothetical protein CAP_5460 [Chondromyces apiculatus DSM 436]
MRVLRAFRVGIGAGVLLATGWALAQEPNLPVAPSSEDTVCARTPTEADLEGAKGAHKAAIQFYERADYDRAIRYWKDAYEFDCTAHGVLINIASAYERKGDRTAAIETLESYLTRAPDASDAITIQERVQNLKAALRAEQEARPPQRPTVKPPPPKPPPPKPEMVEPYGYAPLVIAGAGGAALAIGGIMLPIGFSSIAAAERECPDRTNCEPQIADRGNSGRSQVAAGAVVMGVGALAIGGGLAWHFLFNKPVPVYRNTPDPDAGSDAGSDAVTPADPASPAPSGSPAAPPGAAPATVPAPTAPPPPAASISLSPSVGYGFGGVSIFGRF